MKNTQEIKLKKGEVFLVISSITKQGTEEKMKAYFEKVFPIASKYGFKPLASFPIDQIIEGDYMPNNFVGIYSWPNKAAVKSFLEELPQSELKSLRVEIWDELKQSAIMINKDVSFTFNDSKIYEIRSLWSARELEEITSNGGKVVFDYEVSGYEDLNAGDKPTRISFIEWSTIDKAEQYAEKKKMTDGEVFLTHLEIKK